MRADAKQRRREAGLMLVAACEEVLGACGPTALAALTGRSKSWWSKLGSGDAPFPTWEELAGLLSPGITEQEREKLHGCYRRAWLGLYDPELMERLDSPVPVRAGLADLQALLHTAGTLTYFQEEHRIALRLLKILEMLLVGSGIEALSREELDALRECLDHQSVCESALGEHEASITVARRSVEYQQRGGSRNGELGARHSLGLALHKAGVHQRVDCLAGAAKEFEALQRAYGRLGMTHELVRSLRDGAMTRIYMGRQAEGEAGLLQAYEVPRQSGEDRFATALWLADTTLRREDVPQTRQWLAMLRVIDRRHPQEIVRLMRCPYVAQHVTALERAVTDPRRTGKR